MTAHRTLAILAAALFVTAVGLATVGPRMVSLGAVLTWLSPHGVENLQAWLVRIMGVWSWTHVAQPLMVRPAWLPFGSLGLVCAGVAVSLSGRDAARRSHRRS